jgi:YmgG-like glycine-zipper protein
MAMRKFNLMLLVPAAVIAAACGRNSTPAVDDALKNDLALASQAQAYNPQQFVSPTEAGYAAQPYGYAPQAMQTVARQPVYTAPVRRTSTVRRSSGTSSGGYYPAPAPTHTVKHTTRDAAIGAGAGAVIGAMSSRDKIKGGLIGAAVGGILGGVIGNNVDIQHKSGW